VGVICGRLSFSIVSKLPIFGLSFAQTYHEYIHVAFLLSFAAVGGVLFVRCWGKFYCLTIPFIGALLGAEGFVQEVLFRCLPPDWH